MSRARRRISGAPWINLCAVLLAHTPKLAGALCAGKPEVFDGDDDAARAIAIALCSRCPAAEPCAAWVASMPIGRVPVGVTAGQYRGPIRTDAAS